MIYSGFWAITQCIIFEYARFLLELKYPVTQADEFCTIKYSAEWMVSRQ